VAHLSATVSLEEHGVVTAQVESTEPANVGATLALTDPVTSVVVFSGIVTKCIQNLKTLTYQIQAQDPMSALSEGEVLFTDETDPLAVLGEVCTDYGQTFTTLLTTTAKLAPIDPGDGSDPDLVGWVDLVKTVERILGAPFTYQADGEYHMAAGTARGALTDSQLLSALVAALSDRYANKVTVECSGEWSVPVESATTADEDIRGATMSVTRKGEQIQSILLNAGGAYHSEAYTYDVDGQLTQLIVVDVTTLDTGTKYKTTVTQAWTITDEENYTFAETTIAEKWAFWDTEYRNQTKRTVTTTVVEGAITVAVRNYLWQSSGGIWFGKDGTTTKGFPASPGLPGYSLVESYEWEYDADEDEWDWVLKKTETASASVSAPGITQILALEKHSMSLCSIAEDATAQAALGIKEAEYSPLCVDDDPDDPVILNAIALNEMVWRSRCRQLTAEVALSVAESWLPGDTFTWGGLTWAVEQLDHDLLGRTTQVVATSQASIAYLAQSLMPEYDEAGKAIVGIAKKIAARYDNAQTATIVSRVDYETYKVKLREGKIKRAKLQYADMGIIPSGASVMLIRGSS
jgi:hypothetical protein